MVNKEVIDKTITNLISKSHQHLTLNDKVISTFDKFHDKTCGKKIRKTELGYVVDNDGNKIHEKKGGKNSITFDAGRLYDLYLEHGELHMTHNHPRGGGMMRCVAECLSFEDINSFFSDKTYQNPDGTVNPIDKPIYLEKSITCESPNGSRMTLVRGDYFKQDDEVEARSLANDLSHYFFNYEADYYTASREIMDKHPYNNEKYSFQEYEDYVNNEALKKVGVFHQNDKFKSIQRSYRRINCRLSMSFPREYKVQGYVFG